MPLKETSLGKVCPLDKFEIDVAAGSGIYTADPVETCFSCNFVDASIERFDLDKICKCPSTISPKEYNQLKQSYSSTSDSLTKSGFQQFVSENYKKI